MLRCPTGIASSGAPARLGGWLMGDDSRTPPLSRRVPGAAHAGPAHSAQRVLSDSVLDGMQAAIDAAHAKASGRSEPEPMTEPLQRIPAATLTAKAQAADERPQLPDQLHDYSDQEPPTEPLPRLNFAGAISSDVLSPAVEEISEQPDRVPPPIRSLQPPERLRPPDRVLQRPDRLAAPGSSFAAPGPGFAPARSAAAAGSSNAAGGSGPGSRCQARASLRAAARRAGAWFRARCRRA